MVRPGSTETRVNYDPPASADVKLTGPNHQQSDFSSSGANRATSTADLDEVLKLVAEQACLATSASASAIALSDGGEIVCRATAGSHAPELGARLDSSSGLTGACVRARQVQYCEDTESDTRVNAAACRRLQVRSVLVIPLVYQGDLLGIMEIFSPFPHAFAQHDLQNLEALAEVVLENLRGSIETASLPSFDEPLFATAPEAEPKPPEPWADTPVVVEPSSPLLELSAIRWEPPEARPDLPEFDLPEFDLPEIDPAPGSTRRYRPSELFAPPLEPLPAPAPPPRPSFPTPSVAASLEPEFEPPLPRPAPIAESEPARPRSVSQPPPAEHPHRDWTTAFLTVTVIGVALLLGWMLGHAGWQSVVGAARTGSLSSSSRSDGSEEADASEPIASAAAKPAPGSSRARASSPLTSASSRQADNGLVVLDGSRVIFQQEPRNPEALTDASRPGDLVSLSPEAASAYLIHRVEPVYPEQARLRNVEGEVRLEALVGKDGAVQVLKLLSGNPQLAQAAADAVRQWRFRPYQADGVARPFSTRLTVSFRLQ